MRSSDCGYPLKATITFTGVSHIAVHGVRPIAVALKRNAFRIFWQFSACALLWGCASPADKPDARVDTDRIAREAVYASVLPANGLVETAKGSSLVSLYDNALAAILLVNLGDTAKAERILEFFEGRLASEMRGGGAAPLGFAQFRDDSGNPPAGGEKRWLGDNAWLLIAVNTYRDRVDASRFTALAADLETWIRSLQGADGGLAGGTDEGKPEGLKTIGKVTEAMLDSFNAVSVAGEADSFHADLLDYLNGYIWVPRTGLLMAGENLDPDSLYAYNYALDTCSWGYCAIPGFPASVLNAADRFRAAKTTAEGKTVNGYCFDGDRDAVWYEGTAQMAVAFRSAGAYLEAEETVAELRKGFLAGSADSPPGLPYASNPGTGFGWDSLWQGADTRTATVACIWYLFAERGIDPMALGREGKPAAGARFGAR